MLSYNMRLDHIVHLRLLTILMLLLHNYILRWHRGHENKKNLNWNHIMRFIFDWIRLTTSLGCILSLKVNVYKVIIDWISKYYMKGYYVCKLCEICKWVYKNDTKFCIEFGNIPLNSCSFMYHHGILQSYVFCNYSNSKYWNWFNVHQNF